MDYNRSDMLLLKYGIRCLITLELLAESLIAFKRTIHNNIV